MINTLLILVSLIIIYYVYKYLYKLFNSTSVRSNIDGRFYTVRNTVNKQESADTISHINIRIKKLLQHLKSQGDCGKFQKNVDLLLLKYNENNIKENIDLQDTSYTVNKGQEISFCIATRDSHEKIYDINKLMYVSIHESAHVGCESIGHGEEFIYFFRFLINQSIKCGVYQYVDYSKKPEEYCGMTLSQNIL